MKNINKLNEKDVYSLLLYAIYKCTGNPKYSTISQLIYTLSKDDLLNLCSSFGGCTILIPTLLQLKLYLKGLEIYDLVCKGNTFSDAAKEVGVDNNEVKEVLGIYTTLCDVIEEYGKQTIR